MIERQMLEALKDIFPRNCDRCRQPYDLGEHLPMMLCISQHMCCDKCFKDLCKKKTNLACTSCSNPIKKEEVFKVRKFQAILAFIEKQGKNIEKKIEEQYNNFKNELKQTSVYNPSQKQFERLNQQQKHIQQLRYSLIDQAKDFFKTKPARTAQILQEILFKYQDVEGTVFKGMGSKHEEEGFFHHKISERIQLKNVKDQISLFDLISACYILAPNYASQKAWYDRMIKKYPEDYRIWFGLAVTEDNNKNYETAEKLYHKVGEMNNNFDKPYQLLSFIQMKVHKNMPEALKLADKALKLNNQSIFAQYLIAKTMKCTIEWKIQGLNIVLGMDSNYLAAPLEMGLLYFQMKDYRNAAYFLEKCIDIPRETSNHPINFLILCLIQLGMLWKSEKIELSSEKLWKNGKNKLRSLVEQMHRLEEENKSTVQFMKNENLSEERLIEPQKKEKNRYEEQMDSNYRLDSLTFGAQQRQERQREKLKIKKKEEKKQEKTRPQSNYIHESRQQSTKTPEKKQEKRSTSRSVNKPHRAESVKKFRQQPIKKQEKNRLHWI